MFLSAFLPARCSLSARFFSSSPKFKTIKLTDKPQFPLLKHSATVFSNSGFHNILLDERLLLTPFGNTLSTSSLSLANLIRDEFVAKANQLTRFTDLPYTLLLSNSLDLTNSDRLDHVKKLKESIRTDTVLFFEKVDWPSHMASAIPDLDHLSDSKLDSLRDFDLNLIQNFFFNPVLELFSSSFSVSELVTSDNISKTPHQSPDTLSFINSFLDSLNPFQLVSTLSTHHNLKSTILTILFLKGLISSHRALRVSRIEETVQSSHWGVTDTFELEEANILSQLDRCLNFYKLNS
ncbi:hypothetical protein MACJ_001762 [Theileria orientalis]|uniref:ATP synthase mitochondrial F1 complex assembly factor 2 n=1 Tax=Theileria orientalis TaxID=68886 RepID=A0A976M973_THEOR|nr:hypothetical protein MACJ_001762 [Theileria orientalis]